MTMENDSGSLAQSQGEIKKLVGNLLEVILEKNRRYERNKGGYKV